MKKIVLLALMVLPLLAGAQTKIKETAVPRSVLLALEKTYDSYKVRTWYQAPVSTSPSSSSTARTAAPTSPQAATGSTAPSPSRSRSAPL